MNKMVISFVALFVVSNSTFGVENTSQAQEQAALEQQMADLKQILQIGKLEKKLGYVSNKDIFKAGLAYQQVLKNIRTAVNDLESRQNSEIALEAVSFIVKNKQNALRGQKEIEPGPAIKPHVIYLLNRSQGLSEDEQIKIFTILQQELELKVASIQEDLG